MISQLTERGHQCSIWGPEFSAISGRYDLAIIANANFTDYAAGAWNSAINICHGIVSDERPSDQFKTFYTSEEVRAHWGGKGSILRQPIDLQFWNPATEARRRFVFYSYRAENVFGLDALAKELGLDFVWLKNVEAKEARACLQGAALACASGRAALEAMACGAPTMICDWRGYNGRPLVCPNMDKARAYNYSGRGGVSPSDIDMGKLARETMTFQRPREYVECWHDADKVVDQLFSEARC